MGHALNKILKDIIVRFMTMRGFDSPYIPGWDCHGLPVEHQLFKELKGPKSNIDAKNSELIQLAVAAQIPCDYCIYFHTASAKAYGATDDEIKEAVALGAETRHWSMILQGSQIDLEDFKMEFDQMMKYMAEQASAK